MFHDTAKKATGEKIIFCFFCVWRVQEIYLRSTKRGGLKICLLTGLVVGKFIFLLWGRVGKFICHYGEVNGDTLQSKNIYLY